MNVNSKCPEGKKQNRQNKIDSLKLQSILTRSVLNEHNLQLSGQSWWIRIYFFLVPHGLVENCSHHSVPTALNKSNPGQKYGATEVGCTGSETEYHSSLGHCSCMVLGGTTLWGYKAEETR